MGSALKYPRVLLKLSGEAMSGDGQFGIDLQKAIAVANSVKRLADTGRQIGIVIGAGNIYRGLQGSIAGMPRTPADQVGMLATVINGVILHQALAEVGCKAQVMSNVQCAEFVEVYRWERAMEYLNRNTVVIFVGGTGNPFFTTDSAAALKACEIGANLLIKATKVNGIYTQDPHQFPNATKYDTLSYNDALALELKVMDAAAIALCREGKIPIRVFNFFGTDILHAVEEENCGTLVQINKLHESLSNT